MGKDFFVKQSREENEDGQSIPLRIRPNTTSRSPGSQSMSFRSVDGVQTLAAPIAFESNSYHGAAIREAEQDRFDALYPRLRR